MDETGVCSSSRRNSIKTDLNLLLECLKFQMKCPDLQKQALLTIHSICEKREDHVDLLREMGGVAFVYNLSKSSIVHSDVKEAALFTLGTLVEANALEACDEVHILPKSKKCSLRHKFTDLRAVYCKNSLCRKETFADLGRCLMKEDNPLTQKRVAVYLLSVLVANNKLGQTLAQNTGCLDILLDLFRTTFPLSTDSTSVVANPTHLYQFWTSVSNALCGCVNNPQNARTPADVCPILAETMSDNEMQQEEAQHICVAAFPMVKTWLHQIALQRTEVFQSICSFIAMTVSNNTLVQEHFAASGGLETLALSLVRQASVADVSLMSCQLSVTITKTLSACVTDNAPLASGLAKYGVVSHLFSLLACPNLNPVDRISVLLTLGHCTEASVEHQSQLVQCGGLPLIITLLAEDTCEEVRKTATFILQSCKHATTAFGARDLKANHGEDENAERLTNMESFKSSAKELLHRIDLLEKKQAKVVENNEEDKGSATSAEGRVLPSLPRLLPPPLRCKQDIKTNDMVYRQNSTHKMKAECDNSIQVESVRNLTEHDSELKKMNFNEAKPSERHGWWSLEGDIEPLTTNSPFFKPPAPLRHSVPKEITCTNTEELHSPEMTNVTEFTAEEHLLARSRCAGCVLPFVKVTSRTFASLQSSCRHSCEMHKALQAATEQFRTRHCSLLLRRKYQDNSVELTRQNSESVSATEPQRSKENWSVKEVSLIPRRKGEDKGQSSLPAHNWKKHKGSSLTPLNRGGAKETFTSYNKAATEKRGASNSKGRVPEDEPRTVTDHCSARRRRRKDFSLEEVRCLLSGVKRFGSSWNSILWSYPFQPGRTNVDLAKKYKQLMRGKTQAAGCE